MNKTIIEQSVSITEIQNQLNAKATKSELNSSLKIKANNTEMLQSFNDIHSVIDTLPSNDLLQILLDKKASKDIIDNFNYSINKLTEDLELKANKEFVIHSLHTKENKIATNEQKQIINVLHKSVQEVKVNQSQLNDSINHIQSELMEKINIIDKDLDSLVGNIKQQFTSFNHELNDLNQNKITIKELDSHLRKYKRDKEDSFNNLIIQLKSECNKIVSKNSLSVDKIINKLEADINNNIEINNNKTFTFLNDQTTKINSIHDELKSDLKVIEEKITKMKPETDTNTQEDKKSNELETKIDSNYNKLINEMNSFKNELQNKVTYVEIKELLSNKVDINLFNMEISNKVSLSDLEQYISTFIRENMSNSNDKVTCSMMTSNSIAELSYSIKDLRDSIIMKANIKEVYELLKDKPNTKELNIALTDLTNELEAKVSFNDYNRSMKKQAEMNSIFCKENCLGKWLWTSKELKNSNIKWNIQLVNSSPELYYLEKDTGIIIIRTKGIYHFHIGLLNSNNAFIQISVNGAPLSSHKNTPEQKREEIAMQISEIISIEEEKSRVAISYSGNSNSQKELCFLIIKSII